MRANRAEMQAIGSQLNARFDSLQRTMLQSSIAMIAALVGFVASQL